MAPMCGLKTSDTDQAGATRAGRRVTVITIISQERMVH